MNAIAAIVISVSTAVALAACGPSSDTKGKQDTTLSTDGGMKGMDQKSMSKEGDMKGMGSKALAKEDKSGVRHSATGMVKSLDKNSGLVTVDHEPVKTMNWPAMSMAFKVSDKAMLDQLQPGKKIEFEFVQQGNDYVVTSVK